MSRNIWLYIESMNAWWRTIGNKVPENGKIFDYRPPHCQRCSNKCKETVEYKDKFYCFDCYNMIKSVNFNLIKYLKNREIHLNF